MIPMAMTIGQLARATGVKTQTIRFYESQRLMPEPARRASGYRQYDLESIERVRFIRAAKDVGFTLEEIAGLLALRVGKGESCSGIRRRAEAKVAAIDAKLRHLGALRRNLALMIGACSGRCAVEDCVILEAIQKRGR